MKSTQTTKRTAHNAHKKIIDENMRAYALLDLVNELCFTLDHNFCFTYLNRYTLETFDKSAHELIGRSLEEVFPYSRGMFDFDDLKQRLNSGQRVQSEIQSPLSGCWYQTSVVSFQDEFLVYMTETTATKRYEELLYEKDSLFLAVTNAGADSIIIIDHANRIRYTTPSVSQLTGFTADELQGRKLFEFIAAESRETVQNNLLELTQMPGEASSFMLTLKYQDGGFAQLHATAQNLLKQPGVDGILLKLTP